MSSAPGLLIAVGLVSLFNRTGQSRRGTRGRLEHEAMIIGVMMTDVRR